jgi:hypothetical protein
MQRRSSGGGGGKWDMAVHVHMDMTYAHSGCLIHQAEGIGMVNIGME